MIGTASLSSGRSVESSAVAARSIPFLAVVTISFGCAGPETPASRALALLAREVPRWPRENGCFSCHNNGDGARALFAARRLGREVPADAFASTVEWLGRPESWDEQKGDPAASDKSLARLQFTAALAMADEARLLKDRRAPEAAADSVGALQGGDGAWAIEPRDAMGSPTTWGTHLATAVTCRSLETLDPRRHSEAVARGRAWLREAPMRNVFEAAAVAIGLAGTGAAGVDERIAECERLIARGKAPRGGWGPYFQSPPEPFDTALVLLALASLPRTPQRREWITGGRAFLMAMQDPDGGWPATTRPRGGESYAQSTSTTAWAALALLLTEEDFSGPDRLALFRTGR